MRTIQTLKTSIWSEPDEQRRTYKVVQANPEVIFKQLQNHLAHQGLLPDAYFLISDDVADEMPENMERILCIPSFGAEGVYLSIFIVVYNEQGERKFISFATGKTLGSTADDFLRMSRIAAECSLMLNGDGCDMYQKMNVELMLTEEEALALGNAVTLGFQKMGLDVPPALSSILKKLPVEHPAAPSIEDQLIMTIKNASPEDRLLLAEKLENNDFMELEDGWFGLNSGESKIIDSVIDTLKSDTSELITTLHDASDSDKRRVSLALYSYFNIDILDDVMNSPADGMSGKQQIVNLLLRALGSVKPAKERQDNVIAGGCVLIFENAALSSFGLGTLLEYYLPFDYQYTATKGEYNTMKAILDALKKPPLRPIDNLGIAFPAAFAEDREKVTDMLEDIMTECSYYGSKIPPDVRSLAEDIINRLKNVTAYERKRMTENAQPVKIAGLLEEVDHEGYEENLSPWDF